jgi:aspartate-semialdehyde dehydrogenase
MNTQEYDISLTVFGLTTEADEEIITEAVDATGTFAGNNDMVRWATDIILVTEPINETATETGNI